MSSLPSATGVPPVDINHGPNPPTTHRTRRVRVACEIDLHAAGFIRDAVKTERDNEPAAAMAKPWHNSRLR